MGDKTTTMDWKELVKLYDEKSGPPSDHLLETVFALYFTQEAKVEADEFVTKIMNLYSKMRKMVDMHKVLFQVFENGSGEFKRKKLQSQFCAAYAEAVVSLPHGQVLQIWEMFITSKLNSLIIRKLFSTFMLHLNLVESQIPQHLSQKAKDCNAKMLRVLKAELALFGKNSDRDVCILELSHSWGELSCVQLAYNSDNSITFDSEIKWWDISPLHPYMADWQPIMERLFSEDTSKDVQIKLLDMLVQKLKWVDIASASTDDATVYAHARMSVVRQLVKLFDKDASLISAANIEVVLQVLQKKKLYAVSEAIMEKGISEKELFARRYSKCIRNNRAIHPAVITTAFSRIAVCYTSTSSLCTIFEALSHDQLLWINEDDAMPKEESSLVWTVLKEAIPDVKQLDCQSKPFEASKVEPIVRLMCNYYLPLGCLSVVSQVRCLLGLSSILFTTTSNSLKEVVVRAMLDIFDGERSIWLFDFYDPYEYLRKLIPVLRSVNGKSDYKHSFQYALLSIISYRIFRFRLTDFSKLALITEDKSQDISLLAFEIMLLKELLRPKTGKNEAEKAKTDLSNSLSKSVLKRLGQYSEKEIDSAEASLLIDGFLLILTGQFGTSDSNLKSKTVLQLAKKLFDYCQEHRKLALAHQTSASGLLTVFCQKRKELSFGSRTAFFDKLWKLIFPESSNTDFDDPSSFGESAVEDDVLFKVKKMKRALKATINEKQREPPNEESPSLSPDVCISDALDDSPDPLSIALFEELVKCLELEEYKLTVDRLILYSRTPAMKSKLMEVVTLWQALFLQSSSREQSTEKKEALKRCINEVLLFTLYRAKESFVQLATKVGKAADEESSAALKLAVEILHLAKIILTKGKNILSAQQIVLLCNIPAMASLFLDKCDSVHSAKQFSSVFNGVLELLTAAVVHHEAIVVGTLPCFSSSVNGLLKSLMRCSKYDGGNDVAVQAYLTSSSTYIYELEASASNFDRLINLLCSLGDDYAKYAPLLVAVYINEVQQVAVPTTIKKLLLATVNRSLKVITVSDGGDKRLEKLHCCLSQPGREVFKVLLGNYEKYYRFKGYV